MANVRLMPPTNGLSSTTIRVHARSYTCAAGSVLDVPDMDAFVMKANGWVEVASAVGTTAQRPAKPRRGQSYHDTTLSKNIVSDGVTWRDPATGASA